MEPLFDEEGATLAEARQYLQDSLPDGVRCPCCGQFAKVYARTPHRMMALQLCQIYKLDYLSNDTYFHSRDFNIAGMGTSDFTKWIYWGLVKARPPEGDFKYSGYWAITAKGRRFVLGTETIPSHAIIYNRKLQELRPIKGMIDIQDVLGEKFDYNKVMEGFAK